MKKRIYLMIIAVLVFGVAVSAAAEDIDVNSEVKTNIANGFAYDNNNNDNISIGNIGNNPGGGFTSGPEIPLGQQLLMNKKNLSPNPLVFNYLPKTITREIVQNYKDGVIEERGEKFLGKMLKGIDSRPYVYQKYAKTDQIMPVPDIPSGAEEGIDYVKVAAWQFSALNQNPNKRDFALLLSEKGMDWGADVIIPIGEGAEFVFKNNATALSFFSALAQVFSGDFWGYNISPSLGYYKGKNRAEAFPFMEVVYIKILKPDTFWNAVVAEFQPKRKIAGKIAARSIKKSRQYFPGGQIGYKCGNARECRDRGYDYLEYFTSSSRWYDALDLAILNFTQALSRNLDINMERDIYLCLSAIWREKAGGENISDKDKYVEKARKWAQTAETEKIPSLEALVVKWKKEKGK